MDFEKYTKRAKILSTRLYSGKYENLKPNQKYLYEVMKRISGGNPNVQFERDHIEMECGIDFDFNNRDNFITDFCYNKVNLEDNPNKFLFSPKTKYFQFVDFNWVSDSVVDVSWKIKTSPEPIKVGKYVYDHFEWDFDFFAKYIEKERNIDLKKDLKIKLQNLGVSFPNTATYDELFSIYNEHKNKIKKKAPIKPKNKKTKIDNTILIKGGASKKNTTEKKVSYDELLKRIEDDLESINADIHYKEGKPKYSARVYYERNPKLRTAAILEHGTICMACGFDFERVYGIHGKDYIEVHHVNPISEFDGEIEVSPADDMIVLCSNCHRMVHRKRDKTLSLEELKNLIENN